MVINRGMIMTKETIIAMAVAAIFILSGSVRAEIIDPASQQDGAYYIGAVADPGYSAEVPDLSEDRYYYVKYPYDSDSRHVWGPVVNGIININPGMVD